MLEQQKKLLLLHKKKLSKVNSWTDVPISGKENIRKLSTPKNFLELRVTSGSTGEPLYVFYSKESVQAFIKRAIISLDRSGVDDNDVVLNLFAYGNFVPGSMYEKACQFRGIAVMPLGAPNTFSKEKVIDAIIKVKPNVWMSVPSYAISLLDILANNNQHNYFPKKIIVAGEKLLDAYIKIFKDYKIQIVNHFGLTECPAIGVSKKGAPEIIEIINEGLYPEIIEENETKYLVITDLNNYATPIIRYKTGDVVDNIKYNKQGDLTEITIIGRSDDLIKIQSVLTSKSKIIEIITKYTNKFTVYLKTKNGRDWVYVYLDKKSKKDKLKIDSELFFLKKRQLIFKDNLSIPKTSSYKNKYIIDLRK
jgi:phenylacetate-CoA ligase